jgi:hypothetical protein
MAGNVLRIILYVKEHSRSHFDWESYADLDPDYIQQDWDFRLSVKGLFLASGFLNAIAWMIFAYPMIQMAWLLSKQGTRGICVNITIAMLALGGALTEWLSHLFWIGMNVASTNIVQKFNLDTWLRPDLAASLGTTTDGMGWRVLEINHITGSGFIWFTDAFEWLCLSGIFIFTFVSVRQWRMEDQTSFGRRWNGLTLFLGLLCLLEFVAEILRFEGFKSFGPIAMLYAALNRLILMPAWILALGFMLPRAMLKQAYAQGGTNIDGELALTEMADRSAVDQAPPTFTIDGEEEGDQVPPGPTSPPAEAFATSPAAQDEASS